MNELHQIQVDEEDEYYDEEDDARLEDTQLEDRGTPQ